MKTEQLKLTQIAVNDANPRTISGDKFQKLVKSILVLPKMLELRPIVVDAKMKALGGNMRLQALQYISKLQHEDIVTRLEDDADFNKKTQGERDVLLAWWDKWLRAPFGYVIKADHLSEAEQREFIIKDNVAFGSWNMEKLNEKFGTMPLLDWGMDFTPMQFMQTPSAPAAGNVPVLAPDEYAASPDYTPADGLIGNLPPELAGLDLTPNDLPRIEGTDETARERIIITYKREQTDTLAALLGMASIDKVSYTFDEIYQE